MNLVSFNEFFVCFGSSIGTRYFILLLLYASLLTESIISHVFRRYSGSGSVDHGREGCEHVHPRPGAGRHLGDERAEGPARHQEDLQLGQPQVRPRCTGRCRRD